MEGIKFGIELEMCCNKNYTVMNNLFKQHDINWSVVKDGSIMCKGTDRFGNKLQTMENYGKINNNGKKYGIEIVSPVLSNISDIEIFLGKLYSLGTYLDINQTHGFHVHMSLPWFQKEHFVSSPLGKKLAMSICINWIAFEKYIYSLFPTIKQRIPHSRTMESNVRYIKKVNEVSGLNVNKLYSYQYMASTFNPKRGDFGPKKVYPPGPYHEVGLIRGRNSSVNLFNLNPNASNRKGTIEFRHHNGTLKKDDIVCFVRFLYSFFHSCYNSSTNRFVDARELIKTYTKKSYKNCSVKELETVFKKYFIKV